MEPKSNTTQQMTPPPHSTRKILNTFRRWQGHYYTTDGPSTTQYSHHSARSQRNKLNQHKNDGGNKAIVRLLRNAGRGNYFIQGEQDDISSALGRGILRQEKLRSQAGGHFYFSNNNDNPRNNGAILTIATIIKAVMSSVAEAELGALYLNAREAVNLQQIFYQNGTPTTTNTNPNRQLDGGRHGK